MWFHLLLRLEDRFRGGRGVPIAIDALMDISKRYHDTPYHNTLTAYKLASDNIVGPFRDSIFAKIKRKCGNRDEAAAFILGALEAAPVRPTVQGTTVTIEKHGADPLVFKTSSAALFTAYWDIFRAVDPLLEAILDVGKDAATAEECITELNKVAAYDTAGHVAAAEEMFCAAVKAASLVFGV